MRTRVRAAALAAVIGLVVVVAGGAPAAATAPRSAHCHVVDGAFGACPDGSSEWSDVPAHFFAATNAYLYADEADLDPALASPHSPADTFELMYDECARTTPLGPNEYFLISFDTVEEEGGHSDLVRYNVHVFRDGTIRFFENGGPVPDPAGPLRAHEIEGQHGRAAFGPSPHCAADHLTVEYEIALTATGIRLNGGYSPDPIFWGATPPKQPPVANDDEKELPESDDSVTVPVTANDTDADGSVDPSTVTIVTPPQHGTAVANGDGSVLFTKDDSFKHADSFTYTVADNDGLRSNAARVDITRKCSTQVGSSIDGKSSAEAAGKETKKGTDVDRDGLKHEVEDQLGTDPCHWDSDADGLADPWEVSGVPGAGFDLNGDGSAEVTRDQVFGASDPPDPLFKDVYVEADMYDCAKGGCPLGDPMTHEIDPQAMSDVMMMFDTIPAPNPAGVGTGIDLHLQDGEHIKHAPNCDQPPLANRGPNFGTPDQRANPQIIQAKALAYRYLVASHSTLFDDSADCSASI